MIPRYTREVMGKRWTDQHKFETWLKVELAVIEAKCSLGLVKNAKQVREEIETARKKVVIKPHIINRIENGAKNKDGTAKEKGNRHDVMAFVKHVTLQLKKLSLTALLPLFHQGMTSYDIQDTALSLIMMDSVGLIRQDLENLISEILVKAKLYKDQVQIGRTHGVQAEPITFGLKLLSYVDEFSRHLERWFQMMERLGVGKISGAVGTYANIDPRIEEQVCNLLCLKPARISTQILPRDLHAEYVGLIAMIGGTLDRLGTELRNLQRTEIAEVQEEFVRGQKGSSAMPHKRNPIGPENICSNSRTLRGYVVTAMENMVTWHERDIANSAAERVILVDSSALIDYSLARMTSIIKKLQVNPRNMKRNLELTGGLIFSQKVMLALTRKGMGRETAHTFIQNLCWEVFDHPDGLTFKERVFKSKKIAKLLDRSELEQCFDPQEDLKHISTIFDRFQ